MGYIDENLMDGEQIIYRTKLHCTYMYGVKSLFFNW